MIVELTPEERDILLRMIIEEMSDTRSEYRRTHTPEFRENLQTEREILEVLYHRLSMAGEAAVS